MFDKMRRQELNIDEVDRGMEPLILSQVGFRRNTKPRKKMFN